MCVYIYIYSAHFGSGPMPARMPLLATPSETHGVNRFKITKMSKQECLNKELRGYACGCCLVVLFDSLCAPGGGLNSTTWSFFLTVSVMWQVKADPGSFLPGCSRHLALRK